MQRLDEIATPMRVEKGDLLLRKGSFPAALYVVASGMFKISVQNPDGREQVLYFAPAGVPIMEAYLPGEFVTRTKVVAESAASVWKIPTDLLTVLVADSPPLALAMLRLFAFRLVRRDDIITNKTGRHVNARLAEFLHAKAVKIPAGQPLVIPRTLTGEQAGARLGTVRSEVSRALIRLKRRGLVSFTIKAITVLDLEGLEIAAITG
jgi:CRP/FNR family transcriptional regulator